MGDSKTLRRFCLRILSYLQLHHLMRFLNRKKIVILTYHGFTSGNGIVHELSARHHGKQLPVSLFRKQIEYLKKYRNVISLDQCVEHIVKGARIPDHSVVITIDDGYASNYALAYPILKEFGIPATIFIATDFVDQRKLIWADRVACAVKLATSTDFEFAIDDEQIFLDSSDRNSKLLFEDKIKTRLKFSSQESRDTAIERLEEGLGRKPLLEEDIPQDFLPMQWHQVKEMVRSGLVAIGSHTCSHSILTRCHPESMRRELWESKQVIEKQTGLNCRFFCYPNGSAGDFDERTKALLKDLGYECGLTVVTGLNERNSDVYELNRFLATVDSLVEFSMMTAGVIKLLSNIRNWVLRPWER